MEWLLIVFHHIIDTPILFDPKSKPINLVLFVCFFLNSSNCDHIVYSILK